MLTYLSNLAKRSVNEPLFLFPSPLELHHVANRTDFFFNLFIIFFTLQYCIGFAIHQQASATGVHIFPSWTPLPPSSPYHPSGSSQCTSRKPPVSCIEPGLAIHFLYDIIHVLMPFSQIFITITTTDIYWAFTVQALYSVIHLKILIPLTLHEITIIIISILPWRIRGFREIK